MKQFRYLLFIFFSFLLLGVSANCEEPYLDIAAQPENLLTAIFDVEESQDMYVRVEYRGARPSVSIINPIGLPCTIQEASPSYENNVIIFSIPNAMTGQWYIHTLAEDEERLHISYGELGSQESEGLSLGIIILFIIIALVFIIAIYYLCTRILHYYHQGIYHKD